MNRRILKDDENTVVTNGLHYLSGVDDIIIPNGEDYGEDIEAKLFCIDNQTYIGYIDPNDGYRSYSYFEKTDRTCTFHFEPQPVMVLNTRQEGYDKDDWYEDIVLMEMRDAFNGELVLSIGTDFSDTYYPNGMFGYYPENLECNKNESKNYSSSGY